MANENNSNANGQQLAEAQVGFPAINALPDLSKAEVAPLELVGEYWSPMEKGESKRVFFFDFSTQSVLEQATGEERDLEVVRFVEKNGDDYRLIRNGSARLVGQFQQMARDLKRGRPFLVTYLGKSKTTTGKMADAWSVKDIIIR